MKKIKKKKGSTFVIVVVLMSIIFTLGSAILAVTVSDYKVRINESKKLQNLYLADSGLDIVENIIIKTTQEAIRYADKKVKEDILKNSNENAENKFKEEFYKFFNNKKFININGNQEQVELLKYLILENKYIKSIEEDSSGEIKEINCESIVKEHNFEISIPDGGYKIEDKIIDNKQRKAIEIDILSTFENKNEELKNKKTISTKYVVYPPDYTTEISKIDILSIYDKKAITIDGNMYASGQEEKENNLKIVGDIWVKGTGEDFDDSKFTFSKYVGGIDLKNTNLNLTGNLYTNETLSLRNNVNSIIDGSIYSRNLYIGKEAGEVTSSNNTIKVEKDVIVNNDLALNARDSSIFIGGNFYGINDKTANTEIINGQTSDVKTEVKVLNSSSIIVNENKNSTITIDNNAYIMGVAYLNATDLNGNKYQTGESIAIKGNYLAYSDVDTSNENIKLKYYNPLLLLEGTLNEKVNHFKEYYSNENKTYQYNDGGVVVNGKVKSVGAGIKKNNEILVIPIYDSDVEIQRKEFATNVFAMGESNDNPYDIYEKQTPIKTVGQKDTAQIKLTELEKLNIEKYTKKDEKNNEQVWIIAKKGDVTLTIEKEELVEGLIVVDGNITIEGPFNFSGTIIATGDITFKGSDNKSIKYDANVIKDILAKNKELQNIFNSSNSTSSEIRISSNSEIYNKEKFLKTSSWKIEK